MDKKPEWQEVKIQPFSELTKKLKELRKLVASERDKVAAELQEKEE